MKTQHISHYSNPASTYLNSNKIRGISKRHRTHFTSIQVEKLEEIFTANQNPYRDLIVHLSTSLNLTHKNILIWFKNRRAKEKRQNKITRSDEEVTQEVPEKNVKNHKSTVSKEAPDTYILEPPKVDRSEKSPSQVYEAPTISTFKDTFYHQDLIPKSDSYFPVSEHYNIPSVCYNQQYLYPPSYNPHYRSPYIDYGYPSDSGRIDYSYNDAPIYPSPYYPPAPYSFQPKPDNIADLDPKQDATSTDSNNSNPNPNESVTNPGESIKNEVAPSSIDSSRNDTTYATNELIESNIIVNQPICLTKTATPSVNSQISLSHYKFNYL
ncbi:hypothetical protein LOTGIDRAFT_229731 [Lottia gigantea]|uniref:Homeobox domain-containing protein n=1 Tax=Lottia gigantea TaxID=225164 RepID=V3YX65_LOTGI|nr:hypothetical protein LOTGIDRAFT_229731 [Lottia gigantea]ESO82658.1 hypothetical protein LOTGIDRAFT_229731 [Lottia gigantea]